MATLIYCIYDEIDCYVGSTEKTLKQRMYNHVMMMDCCSRVIIERGNYESEIIEETDEINRYIREQHWIDKIGTLNQQKCYIENHKTHKHDYDVLYKLEHKDRYLKQGRQYYKDNKEQIRERKGVNVICDCGGTYTLCHKKRHFKTLKHQGMINHYNNI